MIEPLRAKFILLETVFRFLIPVLLVFIIVNLVDIIRKLLLEKMENNLIV